MSIKVRATIWYIICPHHSTISVVKIKLQETIMRTKFSRHQKIAVCNNSDSYTFLSSPLVHARRWWEEALERWKVTYARITALLLGQCHRLGIVVVCSGTSHTHQNQVVFVWSSHRSKHSILNIIIYFYLILHVYSNPINKD